MFRSESVSLITLMFLTSQMALATDPDAAQLLEQAIYAEQTVGDLEKAVRLYQTITVKHPSDGDAAAKSQFRIGMTHLKRGDRAEAAKAFQLLIEKYPDQKRLISQARNLLPPVIDEAIERIRANYVDALDDEDELMAAAIRGILSELDPHSDFISADAMKDFHINLSGEVVGIGVAIEVEDGRLLVRQPIVGSPAIKAGLGAGDEIVAIDGKLTSEIPNDELLRTVVGLLRGKAGTAVNVGVRSPNAEQPRDVRVVRGKIKLESVVGLNRKEGGEWQFVLDGDSNIGYVRIRSFRRDTPEEFATIVTALQDQGIEGLVIDLRNNGGGMMQSTVAVADMLLDEGVIVTIKGRGDTEKTLGATPKILLGELPVTVLVNRLTASAAEILAGALRDHGRAVIVGEQTLGKGTVQSLFPLRSGSAIKLTTARFYLPSGVSLQKPLDAEDGDTWGVVPTDGFAIDRTEEDAKAFGQYRDFQNRLGAKDDLEVDFEDAVLRKALDYIKPKIDN